MPIFFSICSIPDDSGLTSGHRERPNTQSKKRLSVKLKKGRKSKAKKKKKEKKERKWESLDLFNAWDLLARFLATVLQPRLSLCCFARHRIDLTGVETSAPLPWFYRAFLQGCTFNRRAPGRSSLQPQEWSACSPCNLGSFGVGR